MTELQDYTVEFTGSIRAGSVAEAWSMLVQIIANQPISQTFKIREGKSYEQLLDEEIRDREEQVKELGEYNDSDLPFLIHILKLIRFGANYDKK